MPLPSLPVWLTVRNFASLSILNRTSLAVLASVPLISAILSLVKTHLTSPSRKILHTLERINLDLENLPERINSCKTIEILEIRAEEIHQVIMNASEEQGVLQNIQLPWTLGSAFVAALFVVTAQLIYQIAAPQKVKLHSRDDYSNEIINQYQKAESPEKIQLAAERLFNSERPLFSTYRAKLEKKVSHFLPSSEQTLAGIQRLSDGELFELLDYLEFAAGQSPAVAEAFETLTDQLKTEYQSRFSDRPDTAKKRRILATIERSSRLSYDSVAASRPVWGLIALFFYMAAAYLTLSISVVQVLSVISATGLNFIELFVPPL